MNYIDLFHGIGGFALGAVWAGMKFENHFCSDIEPYCQKLYALRFPDSIQLGDITKIDTEKLKESALSNSISKWELQQKGIKQNERGRTCNFCKKSSDVKFDRNRDYTRCPICGRRTYGQDWIITGGFPCQDISIAGKGAGITGSRSGLWFEYWRLIRDLRPRFAIMENVGMLVHRGLREVLGSLAEIGYDAEWQDIRASDMGAPHRRERIWIVSYPSSMGWGNGFSEDIGKAAGDVNTFGDKNKIQSTHVADTGLLGQAECEEQTTGIIKHGEDVPNTPSQRLEEQRFQPRHHALKYEVCNRENKIRGERWSTEPDVGRLAHGVQNRVDRLKGLGNAIVPQIAELLFRQIKPYIKGE